MIIAVNLRHHLYKVPQIHQTLQSHSREAETKVKEARAEAIRKKAEVATAAPAAEEAASETPAVEAQA